MTAPEQRDRGGGLGLLVLSVLLLGAGLFVLYRFLAPRPAPIEIAAPDIPKRPAHATPAGAAERPPAAPPATPSADEAAVLGRAVIGEEPDAGHGAFAGRVINWSTSRGVADAELTFSVADGPGPAGAATVRTDDSGRFVFRPARDGVHTLDVVAASGYLPYAPELGQSPVQFSARPGRRVGGITLYLFPALDYTGVVVDKEGAPVSGATVTLFGAHSGARTLIGLEDRFFADAKGEFTFHAPDWALLEATHPDAGRGRGRVDDRVQVSHRLEITVAQTDADADLAVRGTVLDPEGQPVEGARVKARPQGERGPEQDLRWMPRATTDASGGFTLEPLDAGAYNLEARHDDYGPVELAIRGGAEGIVLKMEHGGRVKGVVRDGETGQPVGAVTVLLLEHQDALRRRPVARVSVYGPGGAYEVGGLPPGDFDVEASAYGYATAERKTVSVPAGGEVVVDLDLPRGARLHGTVVEEGSGDPLPLARVSVEGGLEPGVSIVPVFTSAITDESGNFEITGITPGRRSASAFAFMHRPRTQSGLLFEDGASQGPVTFELAALKEGETPGFDIVGIGAVLAAEGEHLLIQRTIDSGGAAKAGIVAGDKIAAVDGVAVTELGFAEAIQEIRGVEGSIVSLTILRGDETLEIKVTRARVQG